MLEKVIGVVAEQLGLDENAISAASSFKEDLNADSLDLFEMTMTLEDSFGVEIPNEELEKIVTVGDVVAYIEAHAA